MVDNRFKYFLFSIPIALLMGISLLLLGSDTPLLALLPPFSFPILIFLCIRPEWGYYALVALIPFQTWEASFSAMKFLSISKFIGILVFIIVISRLVIKPDQISDLKSKLWLLLLLFLVIHLIATAFSQNPILLCINSIRLLLTVYMFFFLTLYFVKTHQDIKRVFIIVVSSISLSASIGLFGSFLHIDALTLTSGSTIAAERVIGTVTDPNFYSLIIIVSLPLLSHLFFFSKKSGLKTIYAVFFLQNFFVVILTYSRAAYLVLFVVITMILIENLKRFHPKYLGFLLLLVFISSVFIASTLPKTSAWKRFTTLTSSKFDASLYRRASYIEVAWEAFKHDPIIGSGPATFPVIFSKSGVAAAFAESSGDYYRKAHNTYLEILVGTGLSGLACFIAILYISGKNFFAAQQKQKQVSIVFSSLIRAMMYAFISIIIYQLFLSIPSFKYTWLLMAISTSSMININHHFIDEQKYLIN